MDKKRSVLNVTVSIISRAILLVAAIFVRRLLIRYIGNNVNGLNSLYTSIIGMLSVVELGVGSAIVFSMYRPIIQKDHRQVAALYSLYRRAYRIIGMIIFLAGLAVMPFIPFMIDDYSDLGVNVYITFFLTLVSVALSYMYSAKSSLIEAHKNNFVTTAITAISRLMRYGLQAAAILIWKSYEAFLICQIIETLLIWFMTEIVIRLRYHHIITIRAALSDEMKSEIVQNVKAMFMHKIGVMLVGTIDSIIISGFVGVAVLGKYTNYNLLVGVMSGVIALFFTPLTSVVGHLCAAGDPKRSEIYFNHFYCLNYILGFIFFLGYFMVADYAVAFCFGPGLKVASNIVFIITLNGFISYLRNAPLLFRDASGTFYYDRWKPIAEGILNLILSLLFVNLFPENYQVTGVIVATIITSLLICDVVEPYVVYYHVFEKSPAVFYIRNYSYIFLFALTLMAMTFVKRSFDHNIIGILVNGTVSVAVSVTILGLLAVVDKGFRREVMVLVRKRGDQR